MIDGGTDSADLGENEEGNISNWSVSKLISSLKYAFRPKDFTKVEAVLVEREDKLKLEIETLKQLKDSFFRKYEEEKLYEMSLEDNLRKCKKECEEMRNTMSKLREENMVLSEREKQAEERCKNLLEEVKRIGEQEKIMIDLRSRNCELECARAKAEGEAEILKKRFEELEKRVLNLESDLPLLRDREDLTSNLIAGENGNVKADETVKVKEVSVGPSCDSPVKANGHSRSAGSGRPPSQNIVQIVDIDSDDDFAPVETLREKMTTHLADKSNSDQICVENEVPTLKRKRTSFIDVDECENGDNDDDTLNGKLKMEKLQEPVCRPDHCPLNHCSTTTIDSDSNGVNRGFATPREDFLVSSHPEQQMEPGQKSQNLINGFPLDGLGFLEESSCSSDSDSDDDNDGMHIIFYHSQLPPGSQREK
ncbi:hypothetical protein DITRI_Ditri04bG0135900 [Diplodiscus trichospermus]